MWICRQVYLFSSVYSKDILVFITVYSPAVNCCHTHSKIIKRMEDANLGVFHKEPAQVFYKQIFSDLESDEINSEFMSTEAPWNDGAMSLATGHRVFIDLDLQDLNNITSRCIQVLNGYFGDMTLDRHCRFYSQRYGGVKRHVDASHDNKSNYTLLIYLTDDFDDGKLSVKLPRSELEIQSEDPDKKNKVFTIVPKKGYGVIFHKSLVHWASEVYTGNKNFLLIHVHSNF